MLVVAVTGVAAHPVPLDAVGLDGGIERPPQVDVRQGTSLAPPVPLPPVRQPLGDATQ